MFIIFMAQKNLYILNICHYIHIEIINPKNLSVTFLF